MGSGLVSGDITKGGSFSGVERIVFVSEDAWAKLGVIRRPLFVLAQGWCMVESFDGKRRFSKAATNPPRCLVTGRFTVERGALVVVVGSGRLIGDGSSFAAGCCPADFLCWSRLSPRGRGASNSFLGS